MRFQVYQSPMVSVHLNVCNAFYHPGHHSHLTALLGSKLEVEDVSKVAPPVPASHGVEQTVLYLREKHDNVVTLR